MAKKITIAEIKIDGLAQAIDNSISLSDALLQIEGSGKTMSERVEQVNAGMQILSDSFGVAKQYAAFLSLAFDDIGGAAQQENIEKYTGLFVNYLPVLEKMKRRIDEVNKLSGEAGAENPEKIKKQLYNEAQIEKDAADFRLALLKEKSDEYYAQKEKALLNDYNLTIKKAENEGGAIEVINSKKLQAQTKYFAELRNLEKEHALRDVSVGAQQQIKAEAERYAQGLIAKRTYTAQVLQIEKESLEEQIRLTAAYGGDTLALEKQLSDKSIAIAEQRKAALAEISSEIGTVMEGFNRLIGEMKKWSQENIDQAGEELSSITAKHAAALEKLQYSQDELSRMRDEAETAQGGRLAIVEEQIAREMEVRTELAKEEAHLADEKEKAEEKKKKLETQKAKADLKIQIIQAIANIAQGITKALSMGPIIGPIMAGLVAAAGAIQIATMTKQLSKLADGGLLRGRSHTQGGMRIEGTNIEVEGGEYVVNRLSTQRNLGLVRYINSQRRQLTPGDIEGYFASAGAQAGSPSFRTMFAAGGQLPAEDALDTYGDSAVLRAIEAINLQPVVSVVDIANVQQNVVQVTEWTDVR